MKRFFLVFLVLVITVALIGCGTKPGNDAQNSGTPNSGSSGSGSSGAESTSNSGASEQIAFSKEGEFLVFKVSPTIKLDENSWLGIVPAGKEYRKEADADEVDIYWTYPENFNDRKADEAYIFRIDAADVEGIEDDSYSMVLCDNDDEGLVILQFPIVIKGANLTADLGKLKIN